MNILGYRKPPPPIGGQGGPLHSFSHLRSEAKTITQLLQLDGVYTEEEATAVLRAAYTLAAKAAQANRPRDYRAAMGVAFEAAKLKMAQQPQKHEHEHTHHNADEERSALIRLARNLGASELEIDGEVIDVPAEDHDGEPEPAQDPGGPSLGGAGGSLDVPAAPATLGLHVDEGGEQ